jgi:hypothetical protein
MGPYAEVDYNVTLCPLQSRLQQIYHGQPYARVDDFIPQTRTLGLASAEKKTGGGGGEALLRPPPTHYTAGSWTDK